jgi:hypothetical protein
MTRKQKRELLRIAGMLSYDIAGIGICFLMLVAMSEGHILSAVVFAVIAAVLVDRQRRYYPKAKQ